MTTKHTTYTAYLKLDDLLNAQQPLTDHADELHFIIVHQVHELWFKLALHHIERARAALDADLLAEAVRLLDQVSGIITNSTAAARHLHTLPAEAFHRFRRFLAPGSGLQSVQFREIEFAAGYRDPEHVAWVQRVLAKDAHRTQVEARLAQPSLADALDALLARHNISDPADVYAAPADHADLPAVCEALSRLDHALLDWRFAHIQLVERTIGTGTTGTGGTTHDYLTATLRARCFPRLWAARDALTHRIDEA
ncbi:MAG: tryptophan 2,3-dioxygenase [Chloroflexi bacterium]|nr:tryptophan 2,3-dioxygenase [Chloroflexota bacterium]